MIRNSCSHLRDFLPQHRAIDVPAGSFFAVLENPSCIASKSVGFHDIEEKHEGRARGPARSQLNPFRYAAESNWIHRRLRCDAALVSHSAKRAYSQKGPEWRVGIVVACHTLLFPTSCASQATRFRTMSPRIVMNHAASCLERVNPKSVRT